MTAAEKPRRTRRRWVIALAVAGALACALAVTFVLVPWRRPKPSADRGERDVPLGVEEAVIIRYDGPRLVARPYRRGASVSVRIAAEAQQGPVRVYDVRYVVALPGEFDLMEYLTSADGSPIDDCPPFKVCGQTRLTKDIETRIREIEDVGVQIWHWYYETLVGLGAAWVLALVGLSLIGRRRRPRRQPPPPPEPSLAELVAQALAALAGGDLSVGEKARLELLLLRHWRERISPRPDRMAAACRAMQQDAMVGRAYETVEAWLHDPAAAVGPAEVLQSCAPLANRSEAHR
jgi:hypothetical protein